MGMADRGQAPEEPHQLESSPSRGRQRHSGLQSCSKTPQESVIVLSSKSIIVIGAVFPSGFSVKLRVLTHPNVSLLVLLIAVLDDLPPGTPSASSTIHRGLP